MMFVKASQECAKNKKAARCLAAFLFIFVFFAHFGSTGGLRANISNSFDNSLLHNNSGKYLWSTWDYLTNPYIYSVHEKNGVSFRFTDNERFSMGGSYVLLGWPIFLALEFAQVGDSEAQNESYSPIFDPGQKDTDFTSGLDVRLMAGTVVYKNLGVGVYFIRKRNIREESPIAVSGQGNLRSESESTLLSSPLNQFSVLAVGVELGQFGGGVDVVQGAKSRARSIFSYSVSLGYKKYGSVNEEVNIEDGRRFVNNAPLLELGRGTINFEPLGSVYFGSIREEFNASFLCWFVLAPFANVGLFAEGQVAPKLTGRDASSAAITQPPAPPPTTPAPVSINEASSAVTVESYKGSGEVFADLDVHLIWNKAKWGTLRFSPAVQLSYQTEKARFDARLNGKIDNLDYFAQFIIPIKFYFFMNEAKTVTLVAGWRPAFNLVHKFTQKIYDFNESQPDDEARGINDLRTSASYTLERGLLEDQGTLVNSISLGLMYEPFPGLIFHLGFGQADGFFNISRMEFGVNYSWGGDAGDTKSAGDSSPEAKAPSTQ